MKTKNTLLSALFALTLASPAFAATADATLLFRPIASQNQEISSVQIVIVNPSKQPIVSVQSWLRFDRTKLTKADRGAIDTEHSQFDFVAPGENTFIESDGIVKIGRSVIGDGITDAEIEVATIHFKTLAAGGSVNALDAAHTSIRVMEEGVPVSILQSIPEGITLGSASTNHLQPTTTLKTIAPTKQATITPSPSGAIMRPTGLAVTTNGSSIIAAWPQPTDPRIAGINLYFGQTSGIYLHRRTVGAVTSAEIPHLESGKPYFVAITTYMENGSESDFSDEVSVIIGTPESSTTPLGGISSTFLASMPSQTASGPTTALLLLFGSIAFIFSWQMAKKRV